MKKIKSSLAKIFAEEITILIFFTFFSYQVSAQDSLVVQKTDTINVQQNTSQNSFATIYFYRPRKTVGEEIEYNVVHNGVAIARTKSGSVFAYQCKNGEQTFTSTKGGKTSLTLNVVDGKQYFVECGLTISATTQPTLNQTTSVKAKKEIARIDKSVANKIAIDVDSDNDVQAEILKQHNSNKDSIALRSSTQDLLATIYFYRKGKIMGAFVGYDIVCNETTIGRIKAKSVVVYRCKSGKQTFSAMTESEKSITLDVVAGYSYFVECGLTMGVAVGRPSFHQVTVFTARNAIEKIDKSVAEKIDIQNSDDLKK